MREPSRQNDYHPIDYDTIYIKSIPRYDIEDYDLYDEKDIEKYIKDVERICRNSYEYKQYIKFLKDNLDMNRCAIYEHVQVEPNNTRNYNKIAIHIHHDPLTLYEIVKIVLNKRMIRHENLDEQLTAKEVMLLHYNLLVGLIPLAETVHELVHNQYLFIPTTHVFGFYRDFVEMYDKYIDNELKDKLERIEAATSMYDGTDTNILETHFLYCDASGVRQLPKYEDVQRFLSNRMTEIDKGLPVPHKDITNNSNCPWDIILH